MSKKPSTRELLSPFTFTFWMAGGCVVLLLLTMSKKKTPAPTVQGLPSHEGHSVISGVPTTHGSIG